METNEIKVGTRYRFIEDIEHANIMLGIGMRKLFTDDEYVSKHLVFIKNRDSGMVGRMIQEGDNVHDGFWDGIVEEDSGLYLMYNDRSL